MKIHLEGWIYCDDGIRLSESKTVNYGSLLSNEIGCLIPYRVIREKESVLSNDENYSDDGCMESLSIENVSVSIHIDDNKISEDEAMKNKVMDRLQENYDKLINDGYEIVGVFLQGSQNYNLQYENSDIDCKAIILPSFDEFLFNKKPISTTLVLENNEHIDLKDIRLMFDCFKKQNINFVEILFTEYKIMNPKYEKLFQAMFDNNEAIAHYDNYKALNCISGMCMEKYKALKHPYPATRDKIDKFGFDGKQLHHILRLNDFIKDYLKGKPYSECLISKNREYLIKVKKNDIYNVCEAEIIAKASQEDTYKIVKDYMANHEILIDNRMNEIMEKVLRNIIKCRFKSELI